MLNRVFFLLFFVNILYANIDLQLPSKAILNEPFKFSIEINGNNIEFPSDINIDGNSPQNLGTSTSTTVLNGKIAKKIKKTYMFFPKSDFTFPSLKFIIDGKEYHTQKKEFILEKPSKTKSDLFDLEIKTSKNDLYIGENFILTILFKRKKDLQIIDLSFNKTDFKDFWFKQLDENETYEVDNYIVQELKFLMIPLKEGDLKLEPLGISAQILDVNSRFSFSNIAKEIKVYSNELSLNVRKLPDNIKLIGDFKIETTIDKDFLKKGEAVSYKVKITGTGNISDIPDLKLDIKNATMYENKPKIETKVSDNDLVGSYEKVFSIIPNESITIPSIKLGFFNKNENRLLELSSKEYKINVENSSNNLTNKNELVKKEDISNTKTTVIVEKNSLFENIVYFILGIVFTLITIIIYFYFINQKRKKEVYNTPLIKKVKKAKSKKELLKVLAIYINIDKNLDELLFKLEITNNVKVIKKEIIKEIIKLKL
ncbi:hypothetical protein GCM10012288_08360 [Malaciobacter pacificus]|uniref:Putative aerotolerance protein BatD n=1 Tax=Malaciobacter pacificus TaxID=1080223 RepID=A0A5C2H8H4_9BACT|nr:BatD family protein [Malaciobacter pacificus]QEP35113.1 putative aerotolerance protein BatD [Malaciobacter pacificus]GGD36641.1 hypothetical protein GCM10012288_08360 [Malaciobacter pacificus]